MEKKYYVSANGQAVETEDLDLLGEGSGLADDRVLAELFRMTPYNGSVVSKGIMPYGLTAAGTCLLVEPNGASGAVKVHPFRALTGSRTAAGTDAKANWRDIRSGIYTGTTTALDGSVSLAANASGNNRIDLIYAAVAVDANGPTDTRLVKDPTSGAIAPATVPTYKQTTVTVGVVTGTPSGSPAYPSLPSDSGGTYYIPLAWVRVPTGFTSGSTVTVTNIATVAPVLPVSQTTGTMTMQPANAHYSTSAGIGSTFGTAGRGGGYLPPTLIGIQTLFYNQTFTSPFPLAATAGTVDSRDWRGRLIEMRLYFINEGDPTSTTSMSFFYSTGASTGTSSIDLFNLDDTEVPALEASSSVRLYCDGTDAGKLKLAWTGSPGVVLYAVLSFTPVFI